MGKLVWIACIVLAMRIARSKKRNENTWGALALALPVLAIIILLTLGDKNLKNENSAKSS